jgi:ankyrin repeat protein
LIAAGADVNADHGDPSFSLLHQAVDVQTDDYAQNGTRPNLAMIELLVASGADVTAGDSKGDTPLALALLYTDMAVKYPDETEALTRLLRTP